ncbi:MAG TPA: hypothetical protein VLT51_13065 [Anaerolineales bacterium]|nr:hypothetical protein [Anaerolineales bacterium]
MDQSFNSSPVPSQVEQMEGAKARLLHQAQNSAKNFYWIAGLSFINSVITAFGGEFYLVMGLASTLIVDYFAVGMTEEAPELKLVFTGVALFISLILSGITALFGFLAIKGMRWSFVLGMVLYGVDTLIMLALQEWKGFIIHLFFLYALFTGLRALNQLKRLENQPQTDFPKNIGA